MKVTLGIDFLEQLQRNWTRLNWNMDVSLLSKQSRGRESFAAEYLLMHSIDFPQLAFRVQRKPLPESQVEPFPRMKNCMKAEVFLLFVPLLSTRQEKISLGKFRGASFHKSLRYQ